MAVKERSFFSTIPGLITGLAGLLTGIVGLITVSVQLGWLGGDDNNDSTPAGVTSETTRAGAPASGGSGTSGGTGATTASNLRFSVEPRQVTFTVRDEERVTIENEGDGPIRLEPLTITGPNRDQFSVANNDCGSTLNAGRSCVATVRFLKTRAGEFTANLVVQPAGTSPPAQEVPLKGSRLL